MRLLKLTWISLHWVEIFPLFWKTVRICAVLLFRFFFLLIARLWRSTCINSELEHLFVQIALVKVSTIMVANTSVKNVWDHVCTFISCHFKYATFWIVFTDGTETQMNTCQWWMYKISRRVVSKPFRMREFTYRRKPSPNGPMPSSKR